MGTKDYIIIGLLAGIVCILLLFPRQPASGSEARRIIDSMAYERRMDSLNKLREQQEDYILDLEAQFDSLTLALSRYENRRHRPRPYPSGADSLRSAILREAGILHRKGGAVHP